MRTVNTFEKILNLLAFFISLLSIFLTASLCLVILLHRQYRQNPNLFLCLATFFSAALFSLSFVLLSIETIKGDFGLGSSSYSTTCRLRGYLLCVMASANYNSYCIQALFRLIRVLYHQYVRIHTLKIDILSVICTWILAIILTSPYIIVKSFLTFIPNTNYCLIPYTNTIAYIYALLPAFGIQICSVLFIYSHLVIFLNHTVVRNAYREWLFVRRIMYIILTIGGMFLPSGVFWIVYLCTQYQSPIYYRIVLLFTSIGTLIINIQMIFITPRLRSIIFPQRQRIHPELPIRPIYVRNEFIRNN